MIATYLITGISATTPYLLEGYQEHNVTDGWDQFRGDFAFKCSETTAKESLYPGQLVPGYTHCYVRDVSFRNEGYVTIASVVGLGMIHTTTTRCTLSGNAGPAVYGGMLRTTTATTEGATQYRVRRFVPSVAATEYRIVTTTVPYTYLGTRQRPPGEPSSLPAIPEWFDNYTDLTWFMDSIDPTTCGNVYLCRIGYAYRETIEAT